MPITYEVNARPTPEEVCALTVAVGWPDPAQHGLPLVQKVWEQAPATVVAREGERLVGFCRAMWDGGIMAFVRSVVVHPDYQRRGIGRRLLELLLEELEKLPVEHISLWATAGTEPFYEQFGFAERQGVTPMMKSRRDHKEDQGCCTN
jgi:N-acetylglutamate synthase-like GNAT family acetyltransferase